MNFVYEPEVAADITEYINYVTPVDGVKELLEKRDPNWPNDPLVFPHREVSPTQLHRGQERRRRTSKRSERRAVGRSGSGAGER